MDEQSEQLTDIKVAVAEIKGAVGQLADKSASDSKRIDELDTKLDVALIPIKAAKFLLSVVAGVAAVVGLANLLGIKWMP